MFNSPLPRLKIVFAVLVMTAEMAICAWAGEATIYRDCFKIEPGQIPHLVCTVEGLEGIDYAVDRYASNDWQVVIHGWGMDDARIKKAKPGAHLLDDNDMPSGVCEVTGTTQPFVFEFCKTGTGVGLWAAKHGTDMSQSPLTRTPGLSFSKVRSATSRMC